MDCRVRLQSQNTTVSLELLSRPDCLFLRPLWAQIGSVRVVLLVSRKIVNRNNANYNFLIKTQEISMNTIQKYSVVFMEPIL